MQLLVTTWISKEKKKTKSEIFHVPKIRRSKKKISKMRKLAIENRIFDG